METVIVPAFVEVTPFCSELTEFIIAWFSYSLSFSFFTGCHYIVGYIYRILILVSLPLLQA